MYLPNCLMLTKTSSNMFLFVVATKIVTNSMRFVYSQPGWKWSQFRLAIFSHLQ